MSQKNRDYFQLNKKMIFTKFKMLFRLARNIYIKIPVTIRPDFQMEDDFHANLSSLRGHFHLPILHKSHRKCMTPAIS